MAFIGRFYFYSSQTTPIFRDLKKCYIMTFLLKFVNVTLRDAQKKFKAFALSRVYGYLDIYLRVSCLLTSTCILIA